MRSIAFNSCRTDNWLILPGCTFKLIWDTLMLILTTLNLFYIPFKVAFPVENSENHWKYNLAFDITPGIVYKYYTLVLHNRNTNKS